MMLRLDELGLLDASADTVEEMRSLADLEGELMGDGPQVERVEEIDIDGPDGPVRVRLYHPSAEPPERLVLWVHGGGWVLGDIDLADSDCRRTCLSLGALVASVEYRLAPECPFPGGLEDARAALAWLGAEHRVGEPGAPRLIVGGDSAGGNLAAALCLQARDLGGPPVDHQLLIYPVTDCSFETASYRDFGVDYLCDREDMEYFWECYAGGSEPLLDPLASVLRAPDLSGLPPATVVLAGCDVLRDEGQAYAARLQEAGVAVDVLLYPGQIHGFWSYADVSDLPANVDLDIRTSIDQTP